MNIPHTTIIIIALAAGCGLFLVLWLLTLCCWCRSRRSKNRTIEEPILPEPPFAPRPTISKSSTLVSPRAASKRVDSFLEPPLQPESLSSNFASAPSELSLIQERRPMPVSMMPMASVPRPATTHAPLNEHGQLRAVRPAHHRSATLPVPPGPHAFNKLPPPAPSAMHLDAAASSHEAQRPPIHAQHMLPHAASMPRLPAETVAQTPLGMSTPATLQLPAPFELPPAGQILRPESPLRNPYDELYGHLGLDADAPTAGSSTPTPTPTPTFAGSRSPATTATVRSRSRSPGPAAMSIPTATPTTAPTPTSTFTTTSTTGPPGPSDAISISGPTPSTSTIPAAPTPASASASSTPGLSGDTTTAPAAPGLRAQWGPNEYPPEKREVRLEPPASRGADLMMKEDFADSDCPPAYSS